MTGRGNPESRLRRRGYQSIFFKLLAVLMGAVLITYLAFGGFYAAFWNASASSEAHKNSVHYADLLSNEIGSPPDTLLAAWLSHNLGRAVAICGNSLQWRSRTFPRHVWDRFQAIIQDTVCTVPGHLYPKRPRNSNCSESALPDSVAILFYQGHLWTAIDKGDYVFIYGSRQRQPGDAMGRDWITLMAVLFFAWLFAWLVLTRILKPLTGLEKGVLAVQAGNLDVRLPERGKDELGALARSFNAMTQSLRERLLARNQLLLDVSHELRSPLTRMRVALEMATPGMAVDSMIEEVNSLEKMVAELLETEHLNNETGGLKLKSSDLVKLITEMVSKVEEQPPGVVWKGGDATSLPIDTDRMRLVLRNVLDNALKYGRTSTRPVEVSLRKEGNFAVIEIRDFGLGIPEEDQRLVFEPFYRVDRSRSMVPGYGLGLSLCKRIVEMHHGYISLTSRLKEGTTVTINLPLQ